ncbi:MAG: hypothetical protein JW904_07015 [Spirochaetales bacterium]|nr:hypothetical protein [Spirochaetales bacterium]
MKHRILYLLVISLFILPVQTTFCEPDLHDLYKDIITDIQFMQSLFPYSEGSKGEKTLINFIETRLTLLEIPYSSLSFAKSKNSHSFSRNIEATIPGIKNETLVICIPINTPSEVELKKNAYSFNIALALSLCKYFSTNTPPVSVKILFLGAEFGPTKQYPLGSNLFLDSFYPESPHAFLYLNFQSIPNSVNIDTGSRNRLSPAWIVSRLVDSLQKNSVSFLNSHAENQMYRTGLTDEKTVIEPFLRKEYPAISLSNTSSASAGTTDEMSVLKIRKAIIDFSKSFQQDIPIDWDQHYLFIQNSIMTVIFPETEYIVIVSILFFIFILAAFIRRRMIRKYYLTLVKNLWNIPLIFIISFVLLLITTYILEGLLVLRDVPLLWKYLPGLFLILKVAIFLFFSAIIVKLLQGTPFSKNGSFFSVTALFFTILSLIIISMINISFSYYFIWALIFIILFTLMRKRFLKILFFLFSPILIIGILYDIFAIPQYRFCEIILFDKIAGNLLIAVIILPFVLLLIRIRLLFRYHAKFLFSSRTIIFSGLFLLVCTAAISVMFIYSPYSADNPAPITITRTVDNDTNRHFLSFSSPVRLPVMQLNEEDFSGTVRVNSREYSLSLPGTHDYFSSRLTKKSFLNRINISIQLFPEGEPQIIECVLSSPTPFVLYDANFPFSKSEEANLYRIHIGANPPKNTSIEMTLPPGNVYDFSVTMRYKTPPDTLDLTGESLNTNYTLIFKKTIHFDL